MAYIHIKGANEPMYFPDEHYGAVSRIFENYVEKKGDGIIKLPSGDIRASEIKRIMRGDTQESNEISDAELDKMDADLQPFLEDGSLTLDAEMQFLKSQGYISLKYRDGVTKMRTMSDARIAVYEDRTDAFRRATDTLERWRARKGRREYGLRKSEESLARATGVVADALRAPLPEAQNGLL